MAVIIPEAVFKNTFAMKINNSTCKKEMQQCMQQKLERLQFRAKIFFLQETLPSPLLTNLIKSIFFPLFLPKYTKCILEEKKKNPISCSCFSFHHGVFNTKPTCHRFCFQKENSILSFLILSLYYHHL